MMNSILQVANTRLKKTDLGRQMLAQRAAMAAAVRMWLITVDGKRDETELLALAQGLGLDGHSTIERLLREGWISEVAGPETAPRSSRRETAQLVAASPGAPVPSPSETAVPASPTVPAQASHAAQEARKLAAARMFAIDLVCRMLAGREGDLRDRWRSVDDMRSFEQWISECAARISDVAGPERAGTFLDRVSEVLGRPIATAA
jgi:hypothetical protein